MKVRICRPRGLGPPKSAELKRGVVMLQGS